MYIVESYTLAVVLTFVTMLCWGSWANTQKLAEKSWRFELFYWDYVIGIVLMSLFLPSRWEVLAIRGRDFLADLKQVDPSNIQKAMLGGVIFNAANILVAAAIAIAGMSVAFPVGIGIALVLGVIINYIATPQGNAVWLFAGVGLVTVAIVIDALAYRRKASQAMKVPTKGIVLSLVGGVMMALFTGLWPVRWPMTLHIQRPVSYALHSYSLFLPGHIAQQPAFQYHSDEKAV